MALRRVIEVERVVPATPEAIFAVLADPARHGEIDGSGSVRAPRGEPRRLELGSTFSMDMHMGFSYATRNRVVEFDEPRSIAWHHFSRFVWRYELTPAAGGTKVVESFDYSVPWGVLIGPLGWPARNRAAMERTLERLEKVVTTSRGPVAS